MGRIRLSPEAMEVYADASPNPEETKAQNIIHACLYGHSP